MEIRILALDLDGTLLNEQNGVSGACRNAIQQARAKGVQTVICTGRNAADSRTFSEQAGGMDWAVVCNGAQVRSLTDGRTAFTELLGRELCFSVLETCGEYGIDPCFYTADSVFYGREFETFIADCASYGVALSFTERKNYYRVPEDGWRGLIEARHQEILKVILHASDPALIDRLHAQYLADGRFEPAPSVMFGGRLKNLELNRRGVSKGRALEELAARLGCTLANVMAMGDSDNDLTMLRMAGLGVAMGNAPDHVKAAADAVTAPNTEDGVAQAIMKYIVNGGTAVR